MSAATASYDAVAIRDRARELGFAAEVDHSPVWGSPFKHVFVFLTEARWDGRLVQISPANELMDAPAGSLIVGEYASVDSEGDEEPDLVEDVDELMAWLAAKQGGERP